MNAEHFTTCCHSTRVAFKVAPSITLITVTVICHTSHCAAQVPPSPSPQTKTTHVLSPTARVLMCVGVGRASEKTPEQPQPVAQQCTCCLHILLSTTPYYHCDEQPLLAGQCTSDPTKKSRALPLLGAPQLVS
jgi:hypothetical protein